MVKQITAVDFGKQAVELSGWDIAKLIGCHYSGDANPIPHDGYFYDARDWTEHGYASCVEFWHDGETQRVVVSCGTVHKSDDMDGAFRCCGTPAEERNNVHAQIDACRHYAGVESKEDYSGTLSQSFPYETEHPDEVLEDIETRGIDSPDFDAYWNESPVWESVFGWLSGLSA